MEAAVNGDTVWIEVQAHGMHERQRAVNWVGS